MIKRKRQPPLPAIKLYRVYGRFGRARHDAVIQEWVGEARTMAVALRGAVLAIMRRPDIKRLRHVTATFSIDLLPPRPQQEQERETHR